MVDTGRRGSSPAFAGRARPREAGSKGRFALHFGEMVLVMFVGMGVFSGLAAIVYAAAGSSVAAQPGWFRVVLMGVNMTVPMVVWMGLRGHAPARCAEMAASMLIPSFAAAALEGFGDLDVMTALTIQHVVMIPAMLGVMLWRYDEYARPHQGHDRGHHLDSP